MESGDHCSWKLEKSLTEHIQYFTETEILCSWMERELPWSPKFPGGARATNTTYSYSQSKTLLGIKTHFCIFLGQFLHPHGLLSHLAIVESVSMHSSDAKE